MLSHPDIVKKAFITIIRHPILWFFGFFAVGGFNLNFLHYQNIPLKNFDLQSRLLSLGLFLQSHPGFLALASLSVLCFSVIGLILTNWSRIMLTLLGEAFYKGKTVRFQEEFKKSRQSLWIVIRISLLTTGLMLLVALALFAPAFLFDMDGSFKILLWEAGLIIFLPLAFTISSVNIFTTFYAVLYNKSLTKALNLGTDFFISRWTQILGLVALLMVVYFGSFVLGIAAIYLARLGFDGLFLLLARFHILSFSAIIVILKVISNILFWFLLAGLSAFFNQAVLILFFELSTPIENEAVAEGRRISPVTLTY